MQRGLYACFSFGRNIPPVICATIRRGTSRTVSAPSQFLNPEITEAFSRRQRRKPHVRDFLRRFRRAPRVVALPGNLKKFRLRGTGTQRANADAVLPHFFRQSFGKLQIETLRRRVRRDVGHRLKRRRRGHDQDVPAAARDHAGQVKMRHVHHRRHIDLRHFDEPVEPRLVKFAVGAKAGVVHEQINRDILFFGELKNLLRAERLRQVRDADERADVMLGAQFRREADEPVAPPRRQHKIRASRRQFPRQSRADPRARARDQRPFALPVIHAGLQRDSTGRARILGEHDPPRTVPIAHIPETETDLQRWNSAVSNHIDTVKSSPHTCLQFPLPEANFPFPWCESRDSSRPQVIEVVYDASRSISQ